MCPGRIRAVFLQDPDRQLLFLARSQDSLLFETDIPETSLQHTFDPSFGPVFEDCLDKDVGPRGVRKREDRPYEGVSNQNRTAVINIDVVGYPEVAPAYRGYPVLSYRSVHGGVVGPGRASGRHLLR